jgi:hypothetical protein
MCSPRRRRPGRREYGYESRASVRTDESGNYRIDGLVVGDGYTVCFYDQSGGQQQYAYGRTDRESADSITVALNGDTTANDTMLTGGELHVGATDAVTGEAVTGFCVDASGPGWGWACTSSEDLAVTSLPAGQFAVEVMPNGDSLYLTGRASATVVEGGTTSVTVTLDLGGAITTTVTDPATGKPVAGTCLFIRTRQTEHAERATD